MWFRVDDKLWGSPKWLSIRPTARALWVTAGAWSMDQLTDGHVPAHVVPILGGKPADAKALTDCGLWETTDGGYNFHDWHDWQPTRESIVTKREADAARKAEWRAKRAASRTSSNNSHEPVREVSQRDNDVTDAPVPQVSRSTRPDPTRPDPTAPKGASKNGAGKPVAPADQVATAVYDASGGMVKYIAIRSIADKALRTGATADRITDAMIELYNRSRPITLETVGQALSVARGARRPSISDRLPIVGGGL